MASGKGNVLSRRTGKEVSGSAPSVPRKALFERKVIQHRFGWFKTNRIFSDNPTRILPPMEFLQDLSDVSHKKSVLSWTRDLQLAGLFKRQVPAELAFEAGDGGEPGSRQVVPGIAELRDLPERPPTQESVRSRRQVFRIGSGGDRVGDRSRPEQDQLGRYRAVFGRRRGTAGKGPARGDPQGNGGTRVRKDTEASPPPYRPFMKTEKASKSSSCVTVIPELRTYV